MQSMACKDTEWLQSMACKDMCFVCITRLVESIEGQGCIANNAIRWGQIRSIGTSI